MSDDQAAALLASVQSTAPHNCLAAHQLYLAAFDAIPPSAERRALGERFAEFDSLDVASAIADLGDDVEGMVLLARAISLWGYVGEAMARAGFIDAARAAIAHIDALEAKKRGA